MRASCQRNVKEKPFDGLVHSALKVCPICQTINVTFRLQKVPGIMSDGCDVFTSVMGFLLRLQSPIRIFERVNVYGEIPIKIHRLGVLKF